MTWFQIIWEWRDEWQLYKDRRSRGGGIWAHWWPSPRPLCDAAIVIGVGAAAFGFASDQRSVWMVVAGAMLAALGVVKR